MGGFYGGSLAADCARARARPFVSGCSFIFCSGTDESYETLLQSASPGETGTFRRRAAVRRIPAGFTRIPRAVNDSEMQSEAQTGALAILAILSFRSSESPDHLSRSHQSNRSPSLPKCRSEMPPLPLSPTSSCVLPCPPVDIFIRDAIANISGATDLRLRAQRFALRHSRYPRVRRTDHFFPGSLSSLLPRRSRKKQSSPARPLRGEP